MPDEMSAEKAATDGWTQCEHVEDGARCGLVAYAGHTMCPEHAAEEAAPIAPGTQPPPITVEVWEGESEYAARVVDVVRIDNTWHVVVALDD